MSKATSLISYQLLDVFFELYRNNDGGHVTRNIQARDSITTFDIDAVSMEQAEGM